jgi:hypothetical protein
MTNLCNDLWFWPKCWHQIFAGITSIMIIRHCLTWCLCGLCTPLPVNIALSVYNTRYINWGVPQYRHIFQSCIVGALHKSIILIQLWFKCSLNPYFVSLSFLTCKLLLEKLKYLFLCSSLFRDLLHLVSHLSFCQKLQFHHSKTKASPFPRHLKLCTI